MYVVDDLREADFGGGLRLPVRWVYHSSDTSSDNPYGWAGFNLTILESKAVKRTGGLYEVTMLGGRVEYFAKKADGSWENTSTQWVGIEDGTKFTITRWDGWEMEFRDGHIYRLTTEDGRTLRWDRDALDARLATRVYEPATNTEAVTVGISSRDIDMDQSSTLRGAHTLTVNGDTYTFTYFGGTLKEIAFPDGRKTQWRFEDWAEGDKRLTLTQEDGWWRSWVFGGTDRRLKTDDYWDYTITGGEPAEDGVVYNRPAIERERLVTGETESRVFESSNTIWKSKDALGNENISYLYKTAGKLYDKVYKRERKRPGQSAATVVWRGVYDSETGDLLSSFDAYDKQTAYAYERFAGAGEFQPPKKVTVTDPMGRTRSIERDLQGNIIEVVGADGVKRKLEYDTRHRLTRVKNAANEVLARYVYGDKDQLLESYDAANEKTAYEYTIHLGEPLLTKITTPEGRVTGFARDSMGRVAKITTPSGAEWDYTYAGQWGVPETITDPLDAQTSFEYDARLNEIKVTDPLNRITETVFDDLDLPMEITDALGHSTLLTHNANRDTKEITDARDKDYGFAWESAGQRRALQWPDGGNQTTTYDIAGRLTRWSAKGGAGIAVPTYNDAGEVTGMDWTAGGQSGSATFARNSLGQITGGSAETLGITVSQSFGYDGEGRLSGISQTAGGTTRSASVAYDLNGRVVSITYPAGFVVGYEYDGDGRVTAIKKDGSTLAGYAYDAAGRLASRTLANGVTTAYTYDEANRLASLTASNASGVLWAERYGYNAAGERIYTLKGATGTAGDAYWLDATGQLRGAKYGSADATASYASQSGYSSWEEWEYDATGNRLSSSGSVGNATYTPNAINQYSAISGVSPVGYSGRGDLTQYGAWTYVYDAMGNLIQAQNPGEGLTAKYARDGFGQRALKDVNGAKTVFFNLGKEPAIAMPYGLLY